MAAAHRVNRNQSVDWTHSWSPKDKSYKLWWPLNFLSMPSACQIFQLSSEISPHLLAGLGHNLVQIFTAPREINLNDLVDPLTFTLVLPWGQHVWLWVKCLNNYWTDCHEIWYRFSCYPENDRPIFSAEFVKCFGSWWNTCKANQPLMGLRCTLIWC